MYFDHGASFFLEKKNKHFYRTRKGHRLDPSSSVRKGDDKHYVTPTVNTQEKWSDNTSPKNLMDMLKDVEENMSFSIGGLLLVS